MALMVPDADEWTMTIRARSGCGQARRPSLRAIHLSELHGAATHLAVVALPLYAVLVVLGRVGRGGDAVSAWQPWVLTAAALGTAASGVTGLLVRGQSETELRGSDYGIGGIHFWLGIALAVMVLALGLGHWRRAHLRTPWIVLGAITVAAVVYQGYLGGRMTYDHGVGVQALGQAEQTAIGASALHVALANGTPAAAAGKQAFMDDGLGCASCHGNLAQGGRGPRLTGGRRTEEFRRVHATGLFPPTVVTDRDFAAIDAWLRTLGSPER
jgi:mono/diheme cytochrome c family protein